LISVVKPASFLCIEQDAIDKDKNEIRIDILKIYDFMLKNNIKNTKLYDMKLYLIKYILLFIFKLKKTFNFNNFEHQKYLNISCLINQFFSF